jgi:Tol biopolymer transport system component
MREGLLALAVAQAVVGCGRLRFDALGAAGPQDGTSGDGTAGSGSATSDAPADALAFSTPMQITELMTSGVNTQDPSVTADRLEIYFVSARTPACAGGNDVWVATRAATTDPWSAPTCVAALSSSQNDSSPEISEDGLTIYLSSGRLPTLGGRDIYKSTRATRTSAWSTPVRIAELSSAANEQNVAVSGDGTTMVIDSDESGNRDLYVSTWSGSAWSTPTLIAALATADTDGSPGLDHDGSRLYFSHGVEADQTSFDIFFSDRSGGVFGPATSLDAVNSTNQDGDPFVTPDGYLFFSSTRGGTVDLYVAAPL